MVHEHFEEHKNQLFAGKKLKKHDKMVHEHFEEHKNQLFAGKKLKKHDRLPKGQKKNRTKVLFRGIRHDCSICRKIPLRVSLPTPLLWNVANRSH